jgi:hypothetical protein
MEFARENFEAVFSENLAKIHVKKFLCNLQNKKVPKVKSDVMEFATIIFSKKFVAILSGPTPLMQSQVSTGSHS